MIERQIMIERQTTHVVTITLEDGCKPETLDVWTGDQVTFDVKTGAAVLCLDPKEAFGKTRELIEVDGSITLEVLGGKSLEFTYTAHYDETLEPIQDKPCPGDSTKGGGGKVSGPG